jgi:CubicO group peptidase (beta-lactamase class C family)
MGLDAIFRVASMTKPVTSVAAMMLAEEGKLQIAAPVADYLPEFKDRTVGVERVCAQRTMTVQDLLRHTSGLTYAQFGDSAAQMLWRDANLMTEDQTNEELVTKLAQLPLMFEPGTIWEYSMSTDVLGRLVEVTSVSLAEFFASRITGPLGMADTAFEAAGERADRVAEPQIDPATGARPPMRDVGRPHRWASGGGGLVSTAADYVRFCQMLLNGGELDGKRLLAPGTVRHMASDHLPPGVEYGETARERFGALAPVPEMGLWLWSGICVHAPPPTRAPAGLGRRIFLGWCFGAPFWIDPAEQLIAGRDDVCADRRSITAICCARWSMGNRPSCSPTDAGRVAPLRRTAGLSPSGGRPAPVKRPHPGSEATSRCRAAQIARMGIVVRTPRCIVQRLSQMTTSPTRHLWL